MPGRLQHLRQVCGSCFGPPGKRSFVRVIAHFLDTDDPDRQVGQWVVCPLGQVGGRPDLPRERHLSPPPTARLPPQFTGQAQCLFPDKWQAYGARTPYKPAPPSNRPCQEEGEQRLNRAAAGRARRVAETQTGSKNCSSGANTARPQRLWGGRGLFCSKWGVLDVRTLIWARKGVRRPAALDGARCEWVEQR